MIQLRYYQQEALDAIYNYYMADNKGNALIGLPTGCHAIGTQILMFNGTVKAVEDVIIGDLLMGPDSQPRKVLRLARGRENMAKIIPNKGEPFIVNMGHMLSLKSTQEKGEHRNELGKLQKGDLYNLPVHDYLNQSKWFKHTRKLWRASVNFPTKSWLPLSPYFIGIFLGDGGFSHNAITITSMDEEILTYFKNEVEWLGCVTRRTNNGSKADTLNIKNKVRTNKHTKVHDILETLGLAKKTSEFKFIPSAYKTASTEDRLNLLAGLIDTDGSLSCGGYDYISKSKQLANDVAFISRSLGFAAYVSKCQKADQHKTIGTYYRVSISGNFSNLPVKLVRKKASTRKQKKDVLVTGFKIEILPEADYYGFELDKDHLYLTADFTVHHNTGKSVLPAAFIQGILKQWPNQRFLMVTHVKELIEQNANVMRKVWPEAPLGIYSAGLKLKQTAHPIVFGGIQSMIKHPALFGHRDIAFVDEAHLISGNETSQYQSFFATIKLINPNLKIIGMSATLYRMGMGHITENGIFTDIVYDKTNLEGFNQLVVEGYIAPLIPLRTKTELDVSDVGVQQGEFVQTQLQGAVDKAPITYKALQELCHAGQNRKSWLIFASGIEHAEHIAEQLGAFGIDCAPVHSKRPSDYNDAAIKAFKENKLRAIVNYGKLTTGFDHPEIDLIGMLRPTLSVPLWVQMLGRGTRPAEGKLNCLVLDFARNTPRLGPINDPAIPKMKKGMPGEMPIKICEACGAYNHTKVRFCCQCGEEFSFQQKLVSTPGTEELIRNAVIEELPIIERFNVLGSHYEKYITQSGKNSIKATYFTPLPYREYILLEASGMAGKIARDWWRRRHKDEPPATVDAALLKISELKCPRFIRVHVNKRHPEILGVEF